MLSPVKSPIRFSASNPATPTSSKPPSIKNSHSTEVPILDDENAFNKYMADLDATMKAGAQDLTNWDEFLAGSSSQAPVPTQHRSLELPSQFKKVADPYDAFEAAKAGRLDLSEGMQRNLEGLIGHTGEDIDTVAAQQQQQSGRHSEDTHSRHSVQQHIQPESEQTTGTTWKQKAGKVLKKLCIPC